MELFGILLSVPVAFVASAVYCFVLARFVIRCNGASRVMWWVSTAILAGFAVEILLLVTTGAVRTREVIGPGFYFAHLAIFVLGTPALANVLILRKESVWRHHWYAVIPMCTAFALVLVLLQYGVSEALFGVDG